MEELIKDRFKAKISEEIPGTNPVAISSRQLCYQSYLTEKKIDFKLDGPYLIIGEPVKDCTWILHLSVVRQQMFILLDKICPELIRQKISWTMPLNLQVHTVILEGGLGWNEIGKIVTIYPRDNSDALRIVELLIPLTEVITGPKIPDAIPLKNCVYASEGSSQYKNLLGLKSAIADWPFKSIAKPQVPKNKKWLNRKYLQTTILKTDSKGSVAKALNFHKWSDIQWCVIKQGLSHQCTDDYGRDISDRLKWQYEMQLKYGAVISLPKSIDYFEENGDYYFVMEFIEGNSFFQTINAIHKGEAWFSLPADSQIQLFKSISSVAILIQCFHDHGIIHRDLSPFNFIVTRAGALVAIDIEICFDTIQNQPQPIFPLGTPGYLSPQQKRMEIPVKEDDVYGLGGLMINVFTGISPTKFDLGSQETLYLKLMFFIKDSSMVSIICCCFSSDASLRPALSTIQHILNLKISLLLTNHTIDFKSEFFCDRLKLNKLIEKSINSFNSYPILGKDDKWYAKSKDDSQQISNAFNSFSWYPDFSSGTTGVLYALTIAEQYGYDIRETKEIFYQNFELNRNYYVEHPDASGGLYDGSAGFSVTMALMVKYGLLEKNIQHFDFINKLLDLSTTGLDLYSGLAGKGIAKMRCAELLEFPTMRDQVSEIAGTLVSMQNKDGSWLLYHPKSGKKGVKHTGLLYGIAGITYFLLEYGIHYYDEKSKNAAIKGLNWLLGQRHLTDKGFIWPVSSINKSSDPWLGYGFTGVAFLFIRAYELLKNEIYKDAADAALMMHPKYISSNYLSQKEGVAGLGEVYLEAWRVFREREWNERAAHIMDFLSNANFEQSDNVCYWNDGNETTPTADFINGNSGIMHFLLRFQNQEKIGFPLLLM